MTTKNPDTSQETPEEKARKASHKESLEPVPKGGMSPLADRKDAIHWATSKDAKSPTEPSPAPPAEPIGGWVDASTGRGKIMVPEKDAPASTRERPTDERSPMRLVKGKELSAVGSAPSSAKLSQRMRARKEAAEAEAEAGAQERQEEDRNQQGNQQDEEEEADDEERDE